MKVCPKCQKQFSDDANFCPVDAARLAPLSAEAQDAGTTDALAAKYDLGEQLGGGRTGSVYLAADRATGQTVAVKVISPAVVALPGLAQRLERELKQLERVQSAGVAKVHASGKRGDDYWVALELVDGAHTLANAITARGPIAVDQAAHLIEVVGEALIEAAQVGVVHRDLAPKNVLFAGADVKLINFSLPVPASDKVAGVPEFVAPEQYDGKAVDQRSNLFSLGALYYFVLTGRPVQVDDTGAIVPPSSLVASPPGLDAVILRALDKSPTKRFLTVRQFVDEVGRVSRGEGDNPRNTQPIARVAKPKAELVQTLLGMSPSAPISTIPSTSPAPGEAALPKGSAGLSTVKPAAPAAPAAGLPPVSVQPSIAPPEMPVPLPPQPADRSPWASAPSPQVPAAAGEPAAKPAASGAADDKFRDTMWFKKGELDVEAAEAAEQRARTGKDGGAYKSDSLPLDERYKDDGTLSRSDKEKYSLRTGATASNPAIRRASTHGAGKVSEDALIGEMKSGRNVALAMIALALVVVAAIVYFLVL